MSKKKKKKKKAVRADSASQPHLTTSQIRNDFIDYNSKGRTPQRFGDTRWQMTDDSQDYAELNNMYKHNGLAHKIVAKPAEDMTRNGWRLVIPGQPEKQAKYQKELERLKLQQVLAQEVIYQRLHGDGYISIGLEEEGEVGTSDKVDMSRIYNVNFVHAFGADHVEKILCNDNPMDAEYGQESALVVSPQSPGYIVDPETGVMTPKADGDQASVVVIDKSRYRHLSMSKLEDDLTGTSIVTRCMDQLKVLDTGLYSTGKMLYEYTLKVLQSSRIATESQDQFEQDRAMLSEGLDTEAIAVIGDDERMEKLSTNPAGIDTLFTFAWQQLSAASEIPKSVLTGQESGTLTGAQYDIVNYYDGIKAQQEQLLRPQIEYIVKLLMHARNVAGGSEDPDSMDWHIEFNPLWSADDKTQADTLLTYVQAANLMVSSGIKDPESASEFLSGQANNSVMGMQTDSIDVSPQILAKYRRNLEKVIGSGRKAKQDSG